MSKETMKTSDVIMFSIGIIYPITMLINLYADNITEVLSNDAKLFILNKKVTINPHGPLWITCNIKGKRKIRQRKRLYHKARLTGKEQHW